MDTLQRDDSESFKGKLLHSVKISSGSECLFKIIVGRTNFGVSDMFVFPARLKPDFHTVTYLLLEFVQEPLLF